MNRGLRSLHSLTPVCKLSPLFPALYERGRICRASDGGRAVQVIDVSVRRSGEEGGTHGTYRTHGTVADGTKGHKRQRDSHAVLHMLRISVPSAYSGERLRSRISLASELRDGTRDSVLALKIHAVLHIGSALHALQMRWLFVGEA